VTTRRVKCRLQAAGIALLTPVTRIIRPDVDTNYYIRNKVQFTGLNNIEIK
jgi:hypothetical protein